MVENDRDDGDRDERGREPPADGGPAPPREQQEQVRVREADGEDAGRGKVSAYFCMKISI